MLAGLAWAGLAYLLGSGGLGATIWGGVLAAPLIGAAVGWLTQTGFENTSGGRRWLVALASLYVGAVLFGLAIGVGRLMVGGGTGRAPLTALVEPVVTVLWGITLTGFVLFLLPLSYFTHLLLEWLETR
ncbi:MAG: hypothetical protein ABI587_16410 [Gemmatimonadales bacterium]